VKAHIEQSGMSRSLAMYGLLIELYPPEYLRQHRAEMLQNFEDLERTSSSKAALWLFMGKDLIISLMSHYINSLWGQAIKTGTSSESQNYSLVILNDRVVPGFAGIMRESVRARNSASDRELKIVVASPSNVPDGKAIKFAKKVTKHVRISRGWSFVSASVQSMGIRELPPLGTPQQTEGSLTAWIVN
jgi:hypothetical protein